MTVAATNSSNEEASWSNYGPCVDIWAPGVNVKSCPSSPSRLPSSSSTLRSSFAPPSIRRTRRAFPS
jgi:subtilisin family serine protease